MNKDNMPYLSKLYTEINPGEILYYSISVRGLDPHAEIMFPYKILSLNNNKIEIHFIGTRSASHWVSASYLWEYYET